MASTLVTSEATLPAKPTGRKRRRRGGPATSLASQGEPMLWLTGGALVFALLMIVGLLGLILYQGTVSLWPGEIYGVALRGGRVELGELTRTEAFAPDPSALELLDDDDRQAADAEIESSGGALGRRELRSENFEFTKSHFTWVHDFEIEREERPDWAVAVERYTQGRFYGFPKAIVIDGEKVVDTTGMEGSELDAARAKILEIFERRHEENLQRREEIERLRKEDIGEGNRQLKAAQVAMKEAAMDDGKDSDAYRATKESFERVEERVGELFQEVNEKIRALNEENGRHRIVLSTWRDELTERDALPPDAPPTEAGEEEAVVELADVVRMIPSNRLGWFDALGVYLSRWGEFLFDEPRHATGEGGVWPAIVGTVAMTMIMVIFVVPFGVLGALYLHEYARDGFATSAVRIAVNNLAGVPSIVFGVFGLGFFCYIVGGTIDDIFFAAKAADGEATYGKGTLVWASLTLALLTLPVVIVAAEEALAAVPQSMREGSFSCGGSKWQTIRRIVLPQAMPGIMTGMILAMARGAGEVAPLMLVGAKHVANELPVDGVAPFIHPDRSFMHLGYQIYYLGFLVPNSEAAKGMVFTTALLLILIIAVLNLTAIWLRNRLRRRFVQGHF